jgi:hypothetical protein
MEGGEDEARTHRLIKSLPPSTELSLKTRVGAEGLLSGALARTTMALSVGRRGRLARSLSMTSCGGAKPATDGAEGVSCWHEQQWEAIDVRGTLRRDKSTSSAQPAALPSQALGWAEVTRSVSGDRKRVRAAACAGAGAPPAGSARPPDGRKRGETDRLPRRRWPPGR